MCVNIYIYCSIYKYRGCYVESWLYIIYGILCIVLTGNAEFLTFVYVMWLNGVKSTNPVNFAYPLSSNLLMAPSYMMVITSNLVVL